MFKRLINIWSFFPPGHTLHFTIPILVWYSIFKDLNDQLQIIALIVFIPICDSVRSEFFASSIKDYEMRDTRCEKEQTKLNQQ